MRKHILRAFLLPALTLWAVYGYAQDQPSSQDREEIVIKKKGAFPQKMDIQLNGDQVMINGKKPEDIEGNIEVIRRKSSGADAQSFNFDRSGPSQESPDHFSGGGFPAANRALLGVLTLPAGDSLHGARVEEVEKGTPADSAGLQKGDLIVKIDDQKIGSAEDLSRVIGSYAPADVVTVSFERQGQTKEVSVKLGRNDNRGMLGMGSMPMDRFHMPFSGRGQSPDNFMKEFRHFHPFISPSNNEPRLGISVEERDDHDGVTVKQVESGSAAQAAGFEPGDVLTQFAGAPIHGIDDVLQAIRAHRADDQVKATVSRDNKHKTLTVTMPRAHAKADL
jgi:membrane-associated protease RseP (regulator of RpoE activity)